MRDVVKVTTLAVALALGSAVVLAETKPTGSGPNPFVDCGIGAALFPNTHWAAVTSNVIWDIGSTAVTSATASPETCSGKKVEAAQFIIDNYDSLAEETARGDGQHLSAMLNILECSPQSRAAVAATLRTSMAGVVAQADYSKSNLLEKASGYYDAMSNAIGSGNCSV